MSRKGEALTLILMLGSAFFVALIVVVSLLMYHEVVKLVAL